MISNTLRKITSIVGPGILAGKPMLPHTRLSRRKCFTAKVNQQLARKHSVTLTEGTEPPVLPKIRVTSALQLDGCADDDFHIE